MDATRRNGETPLQLTVVAIQRDGEDAAGTPATARTPPPQRTAKPDVLAKDATCRNGETPLQLSVAAIQRDGEDAAGTSATAFTPSPQKDR